MLWPPLLARCTCCRCEGSWVYVVLLAALCTRHGSMSVPTRQVCECRFCTHAGPSASLQDNHTAAQPCLSALLDRAADINATVLLLPNSLAGKVALLQEAQVGSGCRLAGMRSSTAHRYGLLLPAQ